MSISFKMLLYVRRVGTNDNKKRSKIHSESELLSHIEALNHEK